MEPPAKRQRIYNPVAASLDGDFDRHVQYEEPLQMEDELSEEDDMPFDPDEELQLKREQCLFKVKSKFEAIFEKYGRDFEGIGDEIAWDFSEVVVANGHVAHMRDEKDPGDSSNLEEYSSTSSAEEDLEGNSEEEVEDDIEDDGEQEEEEDDEFVNDEANNDKDALANRDMTEDDMILRGFAQVNHFMQNMAPPLSPELAPSVERHNEFMGEPPREPASRLSPLDDALISRYGPELGPHIAEFVKGRNAVDDLDIELAWRAPRITPMKPNNLPKVRPLPPLPDPERSPSPKDAPSIWATRGGRGIRLAFSRDDDRIMLGFVREAQQKGLSVSSGITWKRLEELVSLMKVAPALSTLTML